MNFSNEFIDIFYRLIGPEKQKSGALHRLERKIIIAHYLALAGQYRQGKAVYFVLVY